MDYFIQRFQEASTWQGIILFATSVLHFNINQAASADIVAAGVAIAGLIAMILPDNIKGNNNAAN